MHDRNRSTGSKIIKRTKPQHIIINDAILDFQIEIFCRWHIYIYCSRAMRYDIHDNIKLNIRGKIMHTYKYTI